jgi:glutaredoxin-like protein
MALLSEEDVVYLKKEFSEKLKENVKIIFFKSEDACMYCKETKDIITELSSLSDKISLIEYDFDKDKEAVKKYVVKRTPAIIVAGEDKDYGIRFYGIPAGHEFTTIITAIKNVSNKTGNLTENTLSKLKEITKPFNIQVFITPT